MPDYGDRRKYERAKINLSIRYKKLDQYSIPAMTDNVGGGGIMFYTTEDIPKSTYLVLEVPLPIYPEPLRMQGKVVWTKKNVAKNNYSVGLEFTKIIEEDKGKLIKYIQERL
jgi:c-di-GMP-binding flagellar brake protein YcgR